MPFPPQSSAIVNDVGNYFESLADDPAFNSVVNDVVTELPAILPSSDLAALTTLVAELPALESAAVSEALANPSVFVTELNTAIAEVNGVISSAPFYSEIVAEEYSIIAAVESIGYKDLVTGTGTVSAFATSTANATALSPPSLTASSTIAPFTGAASRMNGVQAVFGCAAAAAGAIVGIAAL